MKIIKKKINKIKREYYENEYIRLKDIWNIYKDMKEIANKEKKAKIEIKITEYDIKIRHVLCKIWETL